MALDNKSNRFTNCTGVGITSIKTEHDVSELHNYSNSTVIQEFIAAKQKEDKYTDYDIYSSFGICTLSEFVGKREGFFNYNFEAIVQEKTSNIIVSSSSSSKVYFYSPIVIASPKFEDPFTVKLISKVTGAAFSNHFSLLQGSAMNLSIIGGVTQW